MIKTVLAGLLIASTLTAAPAPKEKPKPRKSLGEWRITTYDIYCNEPQGRQSASGKRLKYGHVAMNGVPMGSKISIDGEVFTVTDRCGIDGTVDIFMPTCDGYCGCNTLRYDKVKIKRR